MLLQTFWQRCKNFILSTFARHLVMPQIERNKHQFMKESGLHVHSFENCFSSAVTAISTADWALEFPRPVPPNIQVNSCKSLSK
jgi:hypothetical protein